MNREKMSREKKSRKSTCLVSVANAKTGNLNSSAAAFKARLLYFFQRPHTWMMKPRGPSFRNDHSGLEVH